MIFTIIRTKKNQNANYIKTDWTERRWSNGVVRCVQLQWSPKSLDPQRIVRSNEFTIRQMTKVLLDEYEAKRRMQSGPLINSTSRIAESMNLAPSECASDQVYQLECSLSQNSLSLFLSRNSNPIFFCKRDKVRWWSGGQTNRKTHSRFDSSFHSNELLVQSVYILTNNSQYR